MKNKNRVVVRAVVREGSPGGRSETTEMRPIATDGVAWFVCVFVCLLGIFVSPGSRC